MESSNNNIHAASDDAQDKKIRVQILGGGTRSKNRLQFLSLADRHRKLTSTVAKHLVKQTGAGHRKCTRIGPNCRDITIGNWNVWSLTGKKQELVWEAQQYRLEIVGVSSTKRRGSGTVELNGGWKFFYSDFDAAMSDQAGVECVVDYAPLGGRVCLIKLRLHEPSSFVLQVSASNVERKTW